MNFRSSLVMDQNLQYSHTCSFLQIFTKMAINYDIRNVGETSGIIKDLQENGFSVVKDVLTNEECDLAISGAWDWLESMDSGINRNEPKSWNGVNWPRNIHGLIQHYKVSFSKWVCDVRVNENVQKVFSGIWGDDNLISSFDGVCIKRPHELTTCRPASINDKSWFHTDQAKSTAFNVPSVNGWNCIQSGVNLEHSSEGDARFRVLSGSHLLHSSAPWNGDNKDWYKLSKDDIDWYISNGCVDMQISCPKGGMVLWDSRAIHCSTNASKDRINKGRFRFTVFVCMIPRSHLVSKTAIKRKRAFDDSRVTSHWPSKFNLFGKHPRMYGKIDKCKTPVVHEDSRKKMKKLV